MSRSVVAIVTFADELAITHAQVYGTTNIHVIDISVIPLHIGAHTQGEQGVSIFSLTKDTRLSNAAKSATTYAIGELGKCSQPKA